jgi:hypothetical protein
VVGQVLRLGSNLVEVPISAMLVLGVGYSAGAQAVGAGRVVETLIGAAVGVLVNVLFPPAVQTQVRRTGGREVREEIAGLLDTPRPHWPQDRHRGGGGALARGRPPPQPARSPGGPCPGPCRGEPPAQPARVGTPPVGRGLREGLDALEHISVSMRTLFRAVYDAVREQIGVQEDPQYADEVRTSVALLCSRDEPGGPGVRRVVRAEMETGGEKEREQLAEALDELRRAGSRPTTC